MIKAIILDLDDTLIDTSYLEPLRRSGNWRDIPKHFNRCSVYKDVEGVLKTARSAGIKVALFSNSPSRYIDNLLRYFEISVDYVVAYHDVKEHKPSREGVDKILSFFDIDSKQAFYLGDSDLDKGSAENAGVEFFSVEWGSASGVDESHNGISKLSELIGESLKNLSNTGTRSDLLQYGNRLHLGFYLEGIKQEVWSFKDNHGPSVQRWTAKALDLSNSFPKIDYIVRALGHSELSVSGNTKSLDYLAQTLAVSLEATYAPESLSKQHELTKSTQCTATERKAQVHGAYVFDPDKIATPQFSELTFLIVDDVCTSGATTDEIFRAITEALPHASVYVFTLVKTLYRTEARKASWELQHNTQLYFDLYNPPQTDEDSSDQFDDIAHPTRRFEKLLSKRFSANYARTNSNFIFHNLKSHSIAAKPEGKSLYGLIQVAKNILQRGNPTVAPRMLREAFGVSPAKSGFDDDSLALISRNRVEWRRLIRGDRAKGRYPAKRFLDELAPKYFGDYGFVIQLIVPEVQVYDMTQVYVEQFQNRQVDFYIPHVGLIIEIDGPQHQGAEEYDRNRDAFTDSLGLKTIRFTTEEIASENDSFIRKMGELLDYIKRVDNLELEGVLQPPDGITLEAYRNSYSNEFNLSDSRLRLTSAIRFQLLLLELLERGTVVLSHPTKLTLINRDHIDFAGDAIEDLNNLLANLLILSGLETQSFDIEIDEYSELLDSRSGDGLAIDFSIFERYDDSFQVNQDVIYSRSDYFDFYRYFRRLDAVSIESADLVPYDFFELSCSDPIEYHLDLSPESHQRESLRYFLSNLFLPYLDEVDFREGQVGIIGSALSRNGTIGLLPTGSGKSICYQLSAILQPAVSFVVCPIKSLMYDQKADLDSIGFTRSNYITSDLKPDQKDKVQRDFGRGKYFFVFISPERFQTSTFRREMASIGLDHSFAYAVIDEAHCLSEWGHDFRTSYLNLSNTIGKLAPMATYIGLTATASVNVLKDIQGEFNIPNEYVRTPLEFTRKELAFHVVDDQGRKTDVVLGLAADMEAKWNANSSSDNKAGIIFTPTVNGEKGCFNLAGRLSTTLDMDVRYYSGSAPKYSRLHGDAFDQYKREAQEDFKLNKYRLLTATKAFGMGVNKGNIAYTIHFGIPGSMEALYQEAGRAGRDKKLFEAVPADCYVLLSKEQNVELLAKIWDQATNVTDLKEYSNQLSRNSDVNTNLFLMTNSLDTINDEFKLIDRIYKVLEDTEGQQSITLSAPQFGVDKFRFEKAIYRLSQLGIVSDWIIEDFFKGTLQIDFKCLSEEQLEKNIQSTIRKYQSSFQLKDILSSQNKYYKILVDRFQRGANNKTQFIFLVLLLWSYDHFVYNRRQSLKNVYEQCSELVAGKISEEEFKERLEKYFRFNESSHRLLHLAENYTDTSLWLSVFYEENEFGLAEIISASALSTLKEQLARFLESYKDNLCLDYLSGVIRLTADQFDDVDGEKRMASTIDRLLVKDSEGLETLIYETIGLKSLFSDDARSRFARLIHEKFPDKQLLEKINEEFGDAYSYHQLLAPLVARLEKLTNCYREIRW